MMFTSPSFFPSFSATADSQLLLALRPLKSNFISSEKYLTIVENFVQNYKKETRKFEIPIIIYNFTTQTESITYTEMEVKKSPKASLENKRLLFTEIGMVLALLAVFFAFEYQTKEAKNDAFADDQTVVEVEDMVPITQETSPPPPEAPKIPVLSDQIDIVDDDIKVEDNILNLEDDANMGVEIMDYVEQAPEEEQVEEEAIPFQLVEEKPSFNGGDANEFSKWVNQHLEYPEIAKENGVQGRVTLQFTVNPDGSVSNVKVLRGVDSSLDKEAVRVVSMSPKWKPGKQRDRAVKVTYTFPVIFQLR